MSFEMISKPKVVKATPALAKRFAEMEAIRGDRPIKPRLSATIRREIQEGRFRTTEWSTYLCEADGKTYRVNGKHTSNILASMNGDFPKDLSILLTEFKGPDIETGAALYETFDPRNSARSGPDINHAYAAANPRLDGVSRRLICNCCTAIAYNEYEDNMSTWTTPGSRARACLTKDDFILWLNELVEGKPQNKDAAILLRSSCVAAIYRSYLKAKGPAFEFWKAVHEGSGTNRKSADRTLRDFLLRSSVAKGSGAGDHKSHVSPREMFVKCIHAWNAWRRNESTDLKYYASSKTPACV